MAEEARHESVRIIKQANKPNDSLTRTERTALLSLRKNTDLTILTADKGNATVIMNTTDYTGCPRRNVPDFGRVFLRSDYTDITQNTYVQS